MFKFLKEKLKGAVSQFSKEIEEKGVTQTSEVESDSSQEEVKEVAVEEKKPEEKAPSAQELLEETEEPKKEGFFSRLFHKEEPLEKVPEEEPIEEKKEELIDGIKEELEEKKPEPKKVVEEKIEKKEIPTIQELSERKPEGFLEKLKQKIVTKKINEKQFDDLFWNLEVILLENNIAVEVIEKIKTDLKQKLVDTPIPRGNIEKTIADSLKQTLDGLFETEKLDLLAKAKEKKPLVICFVGINGSGKTTTIAKFAKFFQNNNKTVVLAAADTFRAAAIDQLQQHADKLGVKLIKHDYGSDAAAVAFDAVKHAEAKGIDIVLIDTAGRMHSIAYLMDEMKKIIRVANPDIKIFVGEAITGNDCTEQAKKFNETIGIDGIVLSKADIDEKGGAAISVSQVTGKPILFLGTGQEYKDLKEFDSDIILSSLGL